MFTIAHITDSATGTSQDSNAAGDVALALYGPCQLHAFEGNIMVFAPVGHQGPCNCGDCDECDNA